MQHPRILEVMRSAVRAAHAPDVSLHDQTGTVPVSRYTDETRLRRERDVLFRRLPIPLAHVSEILARTSDAAANNVVVRTVDGVSILLIRGDDGVLRGFKNSCRHRGVRLAMADCRAKALVCPYHGWTYGIDGALMHVPHENAFPPCDRVKQGLVPVTIEERHGLVWCTLSEQAQGDVKAHLGEVDDEIAALDFSNHVVGARVVTEQRGNWKMLVEAFLEGYHIRTLHRNSVYPFFLDGRSVAERAGHHVRTASPRRAAKEIQPDAIDSSSSSASSSSSSSSSLRLRDIATLTYVLFPSTTLIMHPDWTSLVVVQPLATDRFLWSHTQLLPPAASNAPDDDKARAHYKRSFELIEGSVFQKEDLLMCSEMQAGIETGANDVLTFGRLESAALWLHESIDGMLDGERTEARTDQ